jgi:hypothetical protein
MVGYYRAKDLMFAARVRAGFVPATRRAVFARIKDLKTPRCPFANLNSWPWLIRVFVQSPDRIPGSYTLSARLAISSSA